MFVARYTAQWTFGRLTSLRYRFEADYERVIAPYYDTCPVPKLEERELGVIRGV